MSAKPNVIESETLLETKYFSIKRERLEWPSGHEQDMYLMFSGTYVVVVAIRDGKILLVNQYRHSAERVSTEFPMGGVDPGELPREAAARELREETGYCAEKLTPIGTFYPSVGRQRNIGCVFLAEDLSEGERELGLSEADLTMCWMELSAWRESLQSGKIFAGDTLSAWTLYCVHRESAR